MTNEDLPNPFKNKKLVRYLYKNNDDVVAIKIMDEDNITLFNLIRKTKEMMGDETKISRTDIDHFEYFINKLKEYKILEDDFNKNTNHPHEHFYKFSTFGKEFLFDSDYWEKMRKAMEIVHGKRRKNKEMIQNIKLINKKELKQLFDEIKEEISNLELDFCTDERLNEEMILRKLFSLKFPDNQIYKKMSENENEFIFEFINFNISLKSYTNHLKNYVVMKIDFKNNINNMIMELVNNYNIKYTEKGMVENTFNDNMSFWLQNSLEYKYLYKNQEYYKHYFENYKLMSVDVGNNIDIKLGQDTIMILSKESDIKSIIDILKKFIDDMLHLSEKDAMVEKFQKIINVKRLKDMYKKAIMNDLDYITKLDFDQF